MNAVHEISHARDYHRQMNGHHVRTTRIRGNRWWDRAQERRAVRVEQRAAWILAESVAARRDYRRLVKLARPLYFNRHRGRTDHHRLAGMLRTGRRPMLTKE